MKLEFVKVRFGDDGPTGLYRNGILFKEGDYYHDKIDEWIDGFLAGFHHAGGEYSFEKKEAREELIEEIYNKGWGVPELLKDI